MIAMNAAANSRMLLAKISTKREEMTQPNAFKEEKEEGNNKKKKCILEVDLLDDPLRHVLVIPCPAVDLLELDSMHAKQGDLDDENLKAESRAGAEVALDVCAGLAGRALIRVAGWADVRGVKTGSVAAVEATLDLSILDTEHAKNTNDVRADDLERTTGCCRDGEESLEESGFCLWRATRRSSIHLMSNIRLVFFWNVRSARAIPTNTSSLHALPPALVE